MGANVVKVSDLVKGSNGEVRSIPEFISLDFVVQALENVYGKEEVSAAKKHLKLSV